MSSFTEKTDNESAVQTSKVPQAYHNALDSFFSEQFDKEFNRLLDGYKPANEAGTLAKIKAINRMENLQKGNPDAVNAFIKHTKKLWMTQSRDFFSHVKDFISELPGNQTSREL